MQPAPKSFRLHIGLFGRRNAGKSSLLNALTRQEVSIVSDVAGTTTDPVEKPMELLPLGPVLFIDTAGIDDAGALGQQRVEKTRQVFDRTDLGAAGGRCRPVGPLRGGHARRAAGPTGPGRSWSSTRPTWPGRRRTSSSRIAQRQSRPCAKRSPREGRGMLELREALIRAAPEEFLRPPAIVADLVPPGELAVLVVPIDMEAPKGRLIVPQVQTIRDLLDGDAYCLVVKERELRDALERLHAAAGAGGHRFAGLSEGGRRHAAGREDDLVFHPLRPAEGRPGPVRRGGHGDRPPASPATACWWPRPARIIPSATTSAG